MLVAPQYSAIQKREVTTYQVTSSEKSSMHCTIQQAIDKADPYSRIVISPGQYFESLTITQPLELVGEPGGDEKAGIYGRGCCLSVVGDVECYFENLKIETKRSQFLSTSSQLGKGVFAVRLNAGKPTFFRCELTSVSVGGQCNPSITYCQINGNIQGCGLVIGEEASGVFEHNTISNHIPYAVEISSRAVPTLRENTIFQDPKVWSKIYSNFDVPLGGAVRITRNLLTDVDLMRSVAPRFIQNKIGEEVTVVCGRQTQFDEQFSAEVPTDPHDVAGAFRFAVTVDAGCSPYFEENMITGGHIGLNLNPVSSGLFVNNIFTHASLCGVYAGPSSTAVVRFGIVAKCSTGVIAKNSAATFAQNSIKDNIGSGMLLLVSSGDVFRMSGNSFVGNDTGISVRYAGKPLLNISQDKKATTPPLDEPAPATLPDAILSDTFVSLNKACGVLILGGGFSVTLDGLSISANGRFGAYVAYGASPCFRNSKFERGPVGVLSERQGNPTVVDCHFTSQNDAGIHVLNHGGGTIKNSNFTHFTAVGIHIEDGANPLVIGNSIMSESGTGILVSHGGIGTIRENKIDMVARGVSITTFADPLVFDNNFQSCTEMGIHVSDEGLGTIVGNSILACTVGVGCMLGGECVVRGNTIRQCTRFGVVCSEGSRLVLEKNQIEKNIVGNVLLEGRDCEPYVAKNSITGSAGFGVRSVRLASGLVTRNAFSKNSDGSIGTQDGGATQFVSNVSVRESGPGICVRERGLGVFTNNDISDGETCGIKLCQGSAATITGGTVARNGTCGLLVDSGCGGEIRDVVIRGNLGAGILFAARSESKTKLFRLQIDSNAGPGVEVNDNASGLLDNCCITNHKTGALLNLAGQVQFSCCSFTKNDIGASATRGGCGQISRCTFKLNTCDVEFVNEGHATVAHCDMGDGSSISVLCGAKGKGVVEDCTIHNAVESGVRCITHNKTVVDNCRIQQCEVGMHCEEGCWTTVSNNKFDGCISYSLRLAKSAASTITGNYIQNGQSSGVVIDGPGATVTKNTICQNELHGVVFAGTPAMGTPGAGIVQRRKSLKPRPPSTAGDLSDQPMGKCFENVIRDNKLSGILVECDATGDIYKNDIFGNSQGGIVVLSGGNPDIRQNKIHDNTNSGVVLKEMSSATVKGNEIFSNSPSNVDLQPRCGGTLINNDLHAAEGASVQALESYCAVTENTFRENVKGCGLLLLGPNPQMNVKENRFVENTTGISATRQGASAVISKNVFMKNAMCGLEIENGGAPTVTDNMFENGTVGLFLKTGAAGTVTGNAFQQNAEGISIYGETQSTLRDNKLLQNQKGIVVRMTETLVLELSTFGQSDVAAISVEDGKCTVRKNEFSGGSRGVSVSGQAIAHVLTNKFDTLHIGVELLGRGVARIERNSFRGCETGCRISSNGKGIVVSNNTFGYCTVAGLHSERLAMPTVSRCVFTNCSAQGACGLLLSDLGSGSFTECDFHHNATAVKSHAGGGEVLKSLIHDNNLGLLAEANSSTMVSQCNFFSNFTGDVVSKSGGLPQVNQSFFRCAAASITVSAGGAGTFSQNSFRECNPAIIVEDAANPSFQNNQILSCPTGVVVRRYPSSSAVFLKNLITGCEIGVLAGSNAFAQFSQNFVMNCETGILVERRSTSKFLHNAIHKCAKSGISVKGQPQGLFSLNLVTECTTGLNANFPAEQASRGVGSATDASASGGFLENTFDRCKVNINVQCGDIVLRKNHCRNGDSGVLVGSDARCTLDGNVVYDNTRVGLFLNSRSCTIINNQLYMLNEIGAFECADGIPPLSKDNGVYNHCGFKGSSLNSLAPLRPSEMPDLARAKDNLPALQQSLFLMHTQELPPFGDCGCTAIIGSSDRRNASMSLSAFEERSNTKADDQNDSEKVGRRKGERSRRESKIGNNLRASRSEAGLVTQESSSALVGSLSVAVDDDLQPATLVPTPPTKSISKAGVNSRVLQTQLPTEL